MSASGIAVLDLRLYLGGEEKVVIVVAAVRGLSADDIAAWEDGGSLPVNSRLRIRDLRSSSSSQTVDGALVESVDSLPSCRTFSGGFSAASTLGWRLLRIVDKAEDPKTRGSCSDDRLSMLVEGDLGEASRLVRLNLLRGRPMVDLELEPIAVGYRDRPGSSRGWAEAEEECAKP